MCWTKWKVQHARYTHVWVQLIVDMTFAPVGFSRTKTRKLNKVTSQLFSGRMKHPELETNSKLMPNFEPLVESSLKQTDSMVSFSSKGDEDTPLKSCFSPLMKVLHASLGYLIVHVSYVPVSVSELFLQFSLFVVSFDCN